MNYPEDATALGVERQFMLGPNVLISPVRQHVVASAAMCPARQAALDWLA